MPLVIRAAPAGAPSANGPDEAVFVGTFSDERARRIAQAQSEIRALRASGTKGEGSLGIDVVGGCLAGPAPQDLIYSTWLRTNPEGDFISTSRRVNATSTLGCEAVALVQPRMSPCSE